MTPCGGILTNVTWAVDTGERMNCFNICLYAKPHCKYQALALRGEDVLDGDYGEGSPTFVTSKSLTSGSTEEHEHPSVNNGESAAENVHWNMTEYFWTGTVNRQIEFFVAIRDSKRAQMLTSDTSMNRTAKFLVDDIDGFRHDHTHPAEYLSNERWEKDKHDEASYA